MEILYVNKDCQPWEGDIKTLASGVKEIRLRSRFNGAWVVSNGRPVFSWVQYDYAKASRLRNRFESNKYNYYKKGARRLGVRSRLSKQGDTLTVRTQLVTRNVSVKVSEAHR